MNFKEINPSPRTLMCPGPVDADPRVLRAMSAPILGQFDPEFTALMTETMEMARQVFQTKNHQTYVVDTTSRGGLETILTGAICPGDKVLIPAFGRFGYLLSEILERCGADITIIEREWGTVFEPEEIEAELKKGGYKAVACIHGETSTSMMQPLDEIGKICKKYDALLIVDTVATLGGVDIRVDVSQVLRNVSQLLQVLLLLLTMRRSAILQRQERKLRKVSVLLLMLTEHFLVSLATT